MARSLTSLPKADGFRLPGEFEPKAGCWLGWPERTDVWRNGAKPAQKVWVEIVSAIASSEPVTVCASATQYANARRMLPPQVRVVEMTCNDTWFRDSGPAFLVNDQSGEVRGVDFEFNAYGGLDGGLYYPWDKDDQIAQKILEIEKLDRYRAPFIAEMGGIQTDGQRTLLTTEQCLLNRNRNAHLGKDEMTRRLSDYLGAEQVIWLPRGCKFDETDGHIDDLACFVRPGVVVMQWTDDRDDPQWEIYQEAYDILRSTRDARGRALEVHKLPQPRVLTWTAEEAAGLDQVDGTHLREEGTRICASYINYYAGNSAIVLPLFGDAHDQAAGAVLAELFPRHRIVGIENSREILLGGGNVACITMPQYAASRAG
ncbi:putative agmatine deiminase [Pseudomonas tohonis]|uniref:Agmatine deiminase n=1 Tax=Pseudomonas tohonis TaxID=2725477 RepID=A0A6J4E907_9PSED|nr:MULTISPECIES: agmatine deiminase [Pseudomonas]BBP84431.1 putative agmatine deiminase [Pseudomonas sp. Pc102]BCG25905.1 putative agmatine deiminase [Pseudomonas tohonis]GJN55592.1 putative agmatine deiminase [Pseudomonas tohonis]